MTTATAQELAPEIEAQSQHLQRLREEIAKVIVGQGYMIDRILMALIADVRHFFRNVIGAQDFTSDNNDQRTAR